MRVRELLQHLDGAGLTITDWDEIRPALAEAGLTLETSLNEAQWTELETTEEQAVRILAAAGLDARLHHSGGGIMVAEVRSKDGSGRVVWVTDSEGEEAGPFLVGSYPDADGQPWFESLSGACTEAELVDRVRRGLTEPARMLPADNCLLEAFVLTAAVQLWSGAVGRQNRGGARGESSSRRRQRFLLRRCLGVSGRPENNRLGVIEQRLGRPLA